MEEWIGIGMHRLNAGRVIDMRHRRNFRSRNIEFVDTEKRVLVGSHGAAPVLAHVGHD